MKSVSHPADRCSVLLPMQRFMWPLCFPLALFCEAAAILLRRRPPATPRKNTQRCYETLFDPLCGDTGVWPDYTEGYFARGDETYHEAKLAQFDLILDQTECGPGVRVLDLGCGNGALLARAESRGCEGTGITISSTQVEACQAQGLDVFQCSFDELTGQVPADSFDVIILNGPTEHFVSEVDAAKGREEAIRAQLFNVIDYLLTPGGRVFITCIHFRHPTDPEVVMEHPLRHRPGSYYFYCSNLVGIYSGWYPPPNMYRQIAGDLNYSLDYERDATHDYYVTSKHWSRRLQGYLKKNPGFAVRFLWRFFIQDPRYFFQAFLFWYYDPWTWQFRGEHSSPMRHLWLMFRSPEKPS
jgi:cyclopropane fatty-acyl-phospholipid synthase-like methyltransferase